MSVSLPEFRKLWFEVKANFKKSPARPDDGTRLAFPASPEVAAFLDQISSSTPEKLKELLGFSSEKAEKFQVGPAETTVTRTASGRYPAEVQQKLDDLYAQFGTNLTVIQKINIHDQIAGAKANFSTTPPCKDEDARLRIHLAIEEHEYLVNIGAIEPVLC